MIKFIFAAVWISLATTGAVVYAFQSSQPTEETAQDPNAFKGLDYVKTGVISVPRLRDGRVDGYFLARLVFTADAQRLSQLKLPVEALLSDQMYTHLYGNPALDFTGRDSIDVEAMRNGLRDAVNARVGEKLIHEVLIEQMDYIAKGEIQTSTIRSAGNTRAQPAASGH